MVSLTLHQTTEIVQPPPPATAPLYRVKNEVTDAVGIDKSVFVYATATQLFSHYASVDDMEELSDNYDQAVLDEREFYRQSSVTRDWPSTGHMQDDLVITRQRLAALCDDVEAVQGNPGVIVDLTTTITSGS